MGLFKGIKDADTSNRLPKLGFGRHEVEITLVEGFSYKMSTGAGIVVNYKVVQSGNPADKVGDERAYFQGITKLTLGYIINFAAAALGIDPRDKAKVDAEVRPIVEATMDAAISKEQVFKGVHLIVQVDPSPDKENPSKVHANHTFYPVGTTA